MKGVPAAAGVLGLLALLTWLLWSGLNLNTVQYDREMQALSDFTRFERGISREVLTARAGLSRNYDALVRLVDAYADAQARLRDAAGADAEESAAIAVLAARVRFHQEVVEQFKSKNALLQNSFAYFGLFGSRLAASDDKAVAVAASALAAAMLHLTLDTSPAAAREVEQKLDALSRLPAPAAEADSINAVLGHGRMLHDLLPGVDAILKSLIAEANNREQDTVLALITRRQHDARALARRNRLLLYAASLLLLGGLVYLGGLLHARAMALRRRAAFEHVIASISTRFINTRADEISGHVESALGQLAGCIGADRAYFVGAGGTCRWSSPGVRFPDGWPDVAIRSLSRFGTDDNGIISIPKVIPDRTEGGMDLLATAGIGGWLCIPASAGDPRAMLAFDFARGGRLAPWACFSLFRMAFDAIDNAISRVTLEQEKERLQVKLQQARRLETIGTFASGIAHNFNNIVGAILGYAEIADNRLKGGKPPATSLSEIRRAGERARELIAQILTFGRRGGGRRERLSVGALVEETTALLAASLPSHAKLDINEKTQATIVWAEPAQLQQVILNLCNNAAQAMQRPGIIQIGIEARELAQPVQVGRSRVGPGRFVIVSVSDPGAGMDQATLERIFEPFFTTRADGNGLGLATVREIVEDHGGTVDVQSTPGAGTRFEVWLPSIPFNEPVMIEHAPELALRGTGETVLVLEVDRRRLLRHEEILAALGYEPVGFTEVADAVSACRRAPSRFDAALVCHPPGGAPLDLAAALHRTAPAMPIILAAPSTADLDAPLLLRTGISELVHQPLASSELAAALSRCL
ncbi:MAG: two-component system VirA-like sensor kinase, partial [Bradyrhizobium sp.]